MVTLGFTGVQTMFLRKHNELARALHDLNPSWSNNKLYEEARKINIAFFQRILYTEWLPILFGHTEFVKRFGAIGESTYRSNVSAMDRTRAHARSLSVPSRSRRWCSTKWPRLPSVCTPSSAICSAVACPTATASINSGCTTSAPRPNTLTSACVRQASAH